MQNINYDLKMLRAALDKYRIAKKLRYRVSTVKTYMERIQKAHSENHEQSIIKKNEFALITLFHKFMAYLILGLLALPVLIIMLGNL